MADRTRSPSYPSTPIYQAIDYAKKIHHVERTHAVDRDVAAKAMGYTGVSGRSATILSDLSQYGLLERAGKSEVRISSLAVELLHPDDKFTWDSMLRQAAQKPDLFQKIAERFPDGLPSEAALESYLVKQGFTFAAIPSAIKAYRETFSYLENATESGRSSPSEQPVSESVTDQQLDEAQTMNRPMLTGPANASPTPPAGKGQVTPLVTGPDVRLVNRQIHLGGVIENQAEADELIALITAIRAMLKPAPVAKVTVEEDRPD